MTENDLNELVKDAVYKIRLICVSADANNNKYWFADVLNTGELICRYARVGVVMKTPWRKMCGSVAAAQKLADSKADKKRNYHGDKEPYTDIALSENDTVTIAAGGSLESIAREQIANGDSQLGDLVAFFAKANIHQITSKTTITYSAGQLRTALGVVTPDTIQRARSELDNIATSVATGHNTNNNWRFKKQVEAFLRLIPERVTGRVNPEELFRTNDDVQARTDLLDAMESVIDIAQSDVKQERVFDMTLERVTDRKIIERIAGKFKSTANRHHHRDVAYMKLKNVWAVDISADEFNDIGNTHEFWHGTKASNILAIFKSGLRIIKSGPHTTGKMFGDGVYFAPASTKALNYAKTFWGGKDEGRYFMFLADVSMGTAHTPRTSKHSGWTPPRGNDSTWAKANVSGVANDECIIYSESQAKIRYLCEFVD